ncbi:MAG: hypothetical protein KDA64_08150 [Rhodospirillaceae bacterium]|nr:hypothetical protein [Rhodospirillaceae bacterium]
MFRTNPLKAKLARGEPTLGAWSTWTHAASIELMAMAGYDAIIIDHEHGLGGLAETQSCLQALSAHPTAGLVRIPSADPIYIKRILDIGVEGIMVPGVEDAETARAMVAACRYPPHGTRGSAYGIARASNYGLAAERYRDTSAAELLIIAQIESVAGVLAVDEIAAVDGIDMLFVGPFDLSGSLGKLGRFDDREVRDTIAKAEAAIRDRDDVWFGALPSLDRSAADMVAEGVQFVANRSDGTLMRDAAVADVGDFRTALKGMAPR